MKQNDLGTGEEVTYTYDSLSRLIGAVTTDSPTVPQWGQSFTHDGFGQPDLGLGDQGLGALRKLVLRSGHQPHGRL